MNSDKHEINSKTLKYYRNKMCYSQADLAHKIQVEVNTVSRWELGKNVRGKNQDKLATALGIPVETLRRPPPKEKFERHEPRHKYTISATAKFSLEIVSETYHVNKNAIMDIAPFLFHIIAAASLGKRAVNLDEMESALKTMREISLEKIPHTEGLFLETRMDGGVLGLEDDAINNKQLFFSYDISDDINDISTNPFSQFLKSFIDMMPDNLSDLLEVEWRNDDLPRYHITDSYIRYILLVPVDQVLLKQIMELVLNGGMLMTEINYRVFLSIFSDKYIEENKEKILNEIKEKVDKKQAVYDVSKQVETGEE